LKGPIN
jgi:hypothetical protein